MEGSCASIRVVLIDNIMDVLHNALDRLIVSFYGVRVKVQLEWSIVNYYEDR